MRVKQVYEIDRNTFIYQTNCSYTDEGQIVIFRRTKEDMEAGTFEAQMWDGSRGISARVDVVLKPNANHGPWMCEDVEDSYLHDRMDMLYDMGIQRELRELWVEFKHEVAIYFCSKCHNPHRIHTPCPKEVAHV